MTALWRRLVWWFAGPDIFVSYARLDGAGYAAALGAALNADALDFHCFLDQWDAPPGRKIPPRVMRALRRATMLVVGSPAAASSEQVDKEVAAFRRRNWRIVPIDVGNAIERAPWFPLIEGLALEREPASVLESGQPSPAVIRRVRSSYTYSKRNRRVRRTLGAAATGLLLLLASSIYSALEASARQQETRARQLVLDANQLRAEQGARLPTAALLAAEAERRLADLGADRGPAVRSLGESLSLLRPIAWTATLGGEPRDLRFLPDGQHGLAITADNSVYLLDFREPGNKGATLIASAQDIATPNADGTAVLVAGKATGVWRLPDRQFIQWADAPEVSVGTISADGAVVALAGNSSDLWIWHPNDSVAPKERFDLGQFRVRDMVFAGTAPSLIAASATPYQGRFVSMIEHRIWLLDPLEKRLRFFEVKDNISRVSGAGNRIVLAGRRPSGGRGSRPGPVRVRIWNVVTSQEKTLAGEMAVADDVHIFEDRILTVDDFNDIVFEGDTQTFALVGDGRLQVVDAAGDARPIGPSEVNTTGGALESGSVITFNADGTARLYEGRSEVARLPHDAPVTGGALDAAHGRAITGSSDGVLRIWTLAHPLHAGTIAAEDAQQWLLSGDGTIAATDAQGALNLWTTATMVRIGKVSGSTSLNEARALSRDGRLLAAAGIEGYGAVPASAISLFDTQSQQAVRDPARVDGFVTDVKIADGAVLSRIYKSSLSPARLAVWNTQTGSLSWPYGRAIDPDTPDSAQEVLLGNDGTSAAVQVGDTRVEIWAPGRERIGTTPLGPQERPILFGGSRGVLVIGPGLTEDSTRAFRIQGAGTVRVLKSASLDATASFSVRKGEDVRALSPDSQFIVTRPAENRLRVMDSYSGRELLTLATISQFGAQQFSADSKHFAIADADGVVRVFETRTWHQIGHVPMQAPPGDLLLLGDPLRLMTTGYGRVLSWRWQLGDLLDTVRTTVGRQLSAAECSQHFAGERCPAF